MVDIGRVSIDSYIHETGDIAGVTKERSMLYTLHPYVYTPGMLVGCEWSQRPYIIETMHSHTLPM